MEPDFLSPDALLARYGAGQPWPVTATLELLGGKWKPAILFLISQRIHRFGALHRLLPGISRSMLTHELRTLEQAGLLHRAVFLELPPRVEYTLTELGQSSLPVLKLMCSWGEQVQQHTAARLAAKLPDSAA